MPEPAIQPNRSPVGRERWVAGGFAAAVMLLFAIELAREFSAAKLSVIFMVLYLLPLTAVHEAGHAMCARSFNWQVLRMRIGYGRTVLRFRIGSVPVDLGLLPLGGHVIVAPRELKRPRIENVLIYLAGPAIEVALALVVVVVVGLQTLLAPTDSVYVIAAQAFCISVALDMVFNLLPLPTSGYDGQWATTDGLGALTSLFAPRWYFIRQLALPWLLRAQEHPPAKRIEICRAGLEERPDNPFLRLEIAAALREMGEPFLARQERLQALESADLPQELKQQR